MTLRNRQPEEEHKGGGDHPSGADAPLLGPSPLDLRAESVTFCPAAGYTSARRWTCCGGGVP